jgi:hypothetical protein
MDMNTLYIILSGTFMLWMATLWSTAAWYDVLLKTLLFGMVGFSGALLLINLGYVVKA